MNQFCEYNLLMYFSILSSGSNSESKSVLATEMGRSEGKSSSTGILAFQPKIR
jgi:hypothetical protein